jgi:CheY-like chemotaxis protein
MMTLSIYALSTATLTSKGAIVTTAFNGLEALFWKKMNIQSVVLMDIMMPEMDGLTENKEKHSLGYQLLH